MRHVDVPSQVPAEVREGALLAGKYLIGRPLGAGGMGVVVAARHVQLDQRVALKFLLPVASQEPDAVNRFLREAWATARINNEHVVRVSDVGALENGQPFLVMEYLEGIDLGALLRQRGPLPVEEAVEYLLQACDGIAEAHAHEIVHRDLKPSNCFLAQRSDGMQVIKVLDFGMSKVKRDAFTQLNQSITVSALIMGSPLYMSPEQMNSARDVDARADVWSIGVILYELLTGRCPFVAESFAELAVKVATGAPAPLNDRGSGLPRGLERIISRCLEKDRNHRYSDVGELAMALAEFGPERARRNAERAVRVLRHRTPRSLSPASHAPDASSAPERSHARLAYSNRRPWRREYLLGGLLAAVVAIGALWAWLRPSFFGRDPGRVQSSAPAIETSHPSVAEPGPRPPVAAPALPPSAASVDAIDRSAASGSGLQAPGMLGASSAAAAPVQVSEPASSRAITAGSGSQAPPTPPVRGASARPSAKLRRPPAAGPPDGPQREAPPAHRSELDDLGGRL